jgi:NADH:ubiquinone oxidoreductase subunit K
MIPLDHALMLGGVLFALAVAGMFLNRKNVILLLMCIELMLLAVNFNFVCAPLGRFKRRNLRVLYSYRGGGGVGHRVGDFGGAVPRT